jgi:hypothetical protein
LCTEEVGISFFAVKKALGFYRIGLGAADPHQHPAVFTFSYVYSPVNMFKSSSVIVSRSFYCHAALYGKNGAPLFTTHSSVSLQNEMTFFGWTVTDPVFAGGIAHFLSGFMIFQGPE